MKTFIPTTFPDPVRSIAKGIISCLIVCQMQLSNWRWAATQVCTTCLIVPALSILGLGVLGSSISPEVVSYILSGNIVVSVLFGNLSNVGTNVAYMKLTGMLAFFRMLPIPMAAVIMGTCFSFSLMALPANVVIVVLGSLQLGVPLSVSPLVLFVVPLCCLPMGCIGGVIGMLCRTFPESSGLNFLAVTLMTISGPIVMAPSLLPSWLVALGEINPAHYASVLLRWAVLAAPPSAAQEYVTSVAVLSLLTMAGCWLIAGPLCRERFV